MAYTPKRPYIGQPGTAAATLYTAPAAPATLNTAAAIVKEIKLVNTAAVAAWITIGTNGVAAANAGDCYQMSLAANSTTVLAESTPMNPADTLQAIQGTANAITVSLSVEEGS